MCEETKDLLQASDGHNLLDTPTKLSETPNLSISDHFSHEEALQFWRRNFQD
jgi:hypothetical protein